MWYFNQTLSIYYHDILTMFSYVLTQHDNTEIQIENRDG